MLNKTLIVPSYKRKDGTIVHKHRRTYPTPSCNDNLLPMRCKKSSLYKYTVTT